MSSQSSARRGLWLASAASIALATAPAFAQTPERYVAIHIPAETLDAALGELARATNTNILFSTEAVANLRAPALNGAMSPRQAVERLIVNTGLQVITGDHGALIIRQPAQLTPAAMMQPSATSPTVGDPIPQSPLANPVAKTESPTETISTVVVTARRRAENLQNVPVAVSAFSGNDLAERHITDHVDLANNTPSLTAIQSGFPPEFGGFVIRGQGPAFNGTSGTVTYFAEAPDPTLGLDGRPGSLYDLANVQILKGPQGTLFGKNATGGNVLVEPQRPTKDFGGYIEGQFGNYNDHQFEGALNVPIISDKVLLRIAGTAERRDGYTTDVGPFFPGKKYDNLDDEGVRIGLTVRPIDGLESYTLYRYQQSNTNGQGTAPYAIEPNPLLDTVFPDRDALLAAQQARGIREVSYNLNEYTRSFYNEILNSTTYNINSDLLIKNVISYTRDYVSYAYDYDASPNPVAGQSSPANPLEDIDYYTEELQLQGKALDHHLQYSIGLFDDDQHFGRPSVLEAQVLGQTIPVIEYSTDHSQAAFIQGTYDFGGVSESLEGLSATAGYRYTKEYTSSASYTGAPPLTFGADSFHYGSYTFDVDYKLFRQTLLYATFRDAFKSGGFNTLVPNASPFAIYPPKELKDQEFGLKSTLHLFGIEARTDLDGYFGKYSHIQREVPQVINGIIDQIVESAAQGQVNGFEFEGTVVPLTGLEVKLSYGYTDSQYTKILSSAQGLLDGAPFAYTPRNKVALEARYKLPFPESIGTVTASEDLTYQSKQSVAQTNQIDFPYLPGYGQLNLRLDWDHVMRRPLGIAFYMTNVANSAPVIGQFDGSHSLFFVTQTYGPPRMFGVQLHYAFGGH